MSGKEENGRDCVDDDEWGDLITTPNRLIPNEFFVLKAEEMDCCDEDDEKSRRGGVAERRAANRGFDYSDSRIRVSVSPATVWAQFLTAPSEISLESLLDSPIIMPNSQGSPTSGTLPFPPVNQEILGMNSVFDDSSCDSNSFTYQPQGDSLYWPCISDLQNQPPVPPRFPGALSEQTDTKGSATDMHSSEGFKSLKSTTHNANGTTVKPSHAVNQLSPIIQSKETNMRNSEDGYNWRKYGQKQVKGSEYPRSYYKCTHPSCQVKKKVERSHDGHITEIIYKGAHNHQSQRNVNGSTDTNIAIYQAPDGMDLSSSTSVVTDNSDLVSHPQGKTMGVFGYPEFSSLNTNYDVDEEDHEIHIGTGDEADEDKSDLKRRKKGNFLLESSLVTRAMREPRVVIRIESEIDILDDGYRWRKYGQKVVKGNPNPRSYYKCTTSGCPVRKHVERASDDLKAVLTTYEGKHNHELPAARNRTHGHPTMDHGTAANTPNQQLPKITSIPKPEPLVQDLHLRYNQKLNHDSIPSNFIGNFDPLSFNPVLPDFPMSLPPSATMVHNGFGYNNNGKCARDGQCFVGGQVRDGFLKPKLEQDNSFYDSFDASLRYCRALPNFQS
ncbi:hypothetical protein L1987_76229 [Smallanthus sonchifolius]|uniref:Uncharacterized protein n=1 Tax=Smallanthus sonchifolius TaxID=185202 RepID=A0ACB9A9E9_9ASTR|nr:hypothetical protein L1987_76229 [Smallanthus sonchifolius]